MALHSIYDCAYNELMSAYHLTKAYGFIKTNLASLIYSFIVFVVFVFIFESLISAEHEKAQVRVRVEAADYAATLKTKVDRELNALLFVSGGLSSYLTVYHKSLDHDAVQSILGDLYARTKHVRNLAIAVGYKITYMFPLESNEKAIGVDYRDLPNQWPQVEKAVESRQGVLAGPLTLVQGGMGLIYRYPVFIQDEYWGILSTVINTDSFFKAAFSNLPENEYQFAIRHKDTAEVFYGDPKLFEHTNALITVSDFPNVQWEWAILSEKDKGQSLITLTRLMGVVISVLLSLLVYFFLKERSILTSQAMLDSLTGLANRRLLDFRMTQSMAQAKRFNRLMAVMFIDIDHFKKLNDTYGHDVGDELLKSIAKKLNGCIRDVDTLSRIGGDEFVIVLDEINKLDDASLIAEKIRKSFDHPITVSGKTIKVTLSIGIASYGKDKEDTLKSLMKKADIALYEAKSAGRDCYRVFENL